MAWYPRQDDKCDRPPKSIMPWSFCLPLNRERQVGHILIVIVLHALPRYRHFVSLCDILGRNIVVSNNRIHFFCPQNVKRIFLTCNCKPQSRSPYARNPSPEGSNRFTSVPTSFYIYKPILLSTLNQRIFEPAGQIIVLKQLNRYFLIFLNPICNTVRI